MRWGAGQAVLLFVLVIIVTVSGLWDWLGTATKTRWHALSSLVLVAVISWHAWVRRRWLVRRRPPGDASARPAAARQPGEPRP